MNSILRLAAIVLFSLVANLGFTQDFSNKGRDFWIAYPAHIDGSGSGMGIYITSDVNASGTITVNGQVVPFSVTANNVTRKFVGPNASGDAANSYVYLAQSDGVKTNAGIHVVADNPVAVYAHIIRNARSGASLILPTTVWGREYVLPSYRSVVTGGTNGGIGGLVVMAANANTVVEIVPAVATASGRPAGTPYTITLPNVGDVYQVQFASLADISGTIVRSVSSGSGTSCNPIAVYSSTTWSAFDCSNASGGDNLYQQLFPTGAWGRNFVTAPFINRQYDIFKVYTHQPNTVITKTENGVTTTITTNALGFAEFKTNNPTIITATKPISVAQFLTSTTCSNGCAGGSSSVACLGDPEMVVLNPVEQTINNITVFSPHRNQVAPISSNISNCYINIVIKTAAAASFRINGTAPVGVFTPIPGSNYSYIQADVTALSAGSQPVQTLTADSAFSAIAYGVGSVESYGYNAGTNVQDLYSPYILQNQFTTINFPSTCVNTPFKLKLTFPYQTTSLAINFNNNAALTPNSSFTINNPVPDSSFTRDGRTFYVYFLPGFYTATAAGAIPFTVSSNNPTSDGCSGAQVRTDSIVVFGRPGANFNFTHTGCVSDSVRFQDITSANRPVVRWRWEFGDATTDSIRNPVKRYLAAGTYNVKLTTITDIGCIDDTTKPITISLPPMANFGVSDTTCVGKTIVLTDSSSVPSGTITQWFWDYGNGIRDTASSSIPRTVTYTTPGNYTVGLSVLASGGCRSNLFTRTFTVRANPTPNFTVGNICRPIGTANFTNLTVPANVVDTLRYVWSFGNGNTDTAKNPIYLYGNAAGPFSVTLTAASAFGCVKDTTIQVTNVFAQPKAGFTLADEACLRDSIFGTDTSNAFGSTIVAWNWNMGDGITPPYTAQNMAHLYAAADTFQVQLFVTTDKGCRSDTASKNVIINPLPTAGFTQSAILCERRGIVFTDASNTFGAGTVNTNFWNMGDGTLLNPTSLAPFTHTYDTAGVYTVLHAVTSSKGCKSDTTRTPITVHVTPYANFGLPEVCLQDAFAEFADSATIANNSTLIYSWNFADPNATPANPNTSAVPSPKHKYTATGVYPVFMLVVSNQGCRDSITRNLTVNGAVPQAKFTLVNPRQNWCANEPVTLRNLSTVDFGDVTKLEIIWDFTTNPTQVQVDNTPLLNKQYTHNYPVFYGPSPRTVTIRLRAFSGGSCFSTKDSSFTLYPSPRVILDSIRGICLDAAPRFITQGRDSAALAGAFIYSGTGIASSGLFNPLLAGAGTYTIQYKYETTFGCRDSATKPITVWPRPVANWGFSTPTCANNAVTFTDSSVANFSNIAQWQWNFDDGTPTLNGTNNAPFTRVFSNARDYNIWLRVVTDSGCTSVPDTNVVIINPLPTVGFTVPTVVCLPDGRASFTNTTTIAGGNPASLSYLWSFGDASNPTSSTQINPTHQYSTVGPKTVKLIVTTPAGCIDSSSVVFNNIMPQPEANFTTNVPFVCVGTGVQFTDASVSTTSSVTEWNWFMGDGTNAITTRNPLYTYSSSNRQGYTVRMFIKNAQGCVSDTAEQTIPVYDFPVANAGPSLFVLEGGQQVINATATGFGLSY
ncbi:MAG: PKD domain-containing protein, partial [Bacteroidetes bacterium]